jgi:23S rRNA pseudouridine1911/1915/1917 synthase
MCIYEKCRESLQCLVKDLKLYLNSSPVPLYARSAFYLLPSVFCLPHSEFRIPLSAFCLLPSAFPIPPCYNLSVSSPDSATHRELVASASDSGTRLDRFIAAQCPELSRTRVQELIASGVVQIEGSAARKGALHLRGSEKITLEITERPPIRVEAESIPLDVLYEDDDIIAINKPAGMTVHAGAGTISGTLVNALLGRGQSLSQSGDPLRPGIVHRLDKETSGVILVAKNDAAHAKLGEAFRQRKVKKTYLALVQGLLKRESGRIELAIGRDPIHRTRMAVERKAWHGAAMTNPRAARTDWRSLATIGNTTLVEVQLHTGRTHQIRVHFSAIKHPVVGDTLYGAAGQLRVEKTELPALGRNFLHAAKLGFAQPRTGQWIEVQAAVPVELQDFLKKLSAAAGDSPGRIDAALAGYL